MPIGKNAIKRVENNGYSNVKSSAPDMENSEIVAPAVSAEAEGRKDAPVQETAQAQPLPEKTGKKRGRPAKTGNSGKDEPKEPAVKKEKAVAEKAATDKKAVADKAEKKDAGDKKGEVNKKRAPRGARKAAAKPSAAGNRAKKEKNGFERIEVGGEMPYWLL